LKARLSLYIKSICVVTAISTSGLSSAQGDTISTSLGKNVVSHDVLFYNISHIFSLDERIKRGLFPPFMPGFGFSYSQNFRNHQKFGFEIFGDFFSANYKPIAESGVYSPTEVYAREFQRVGFLAAYSIYSAPLITISTKVGTVITYGTESVTYTDLGYEILGYSHQLLDPGLLGKVSLTTQMSRHFFSSIQFFGQKVVYRQNKGADSIPTIGLPEDFGSPKHSFGWTIGLGFNW
jgi:hypothetical protein